MLRKWRVLLVALVLLFVAATPALADSARGGQVLFGRSFELPAGQVVDGDVAVFGGSVVLGAGSRVRGDVAVFGGPIDIAGQVDGNVFCFGASVRLRSTAVVEGDLFTTGELIEESGAVVRGHRMGALREGVGGRVETPVRPRPNISPLPPSVLSGRWFWEPFGSLLNGFFRAVLGTLAMVAVGVLIVLLVPGLLQTVSETLTAHPLPSIGVGLLTGVVAVVVIPLLAITCIGLPLGLLALALAVLFGWIAAALALGDRLLEALKQTRRETLLSVVVGVVFLALLANVPCLGWLVGLLIAAWGLGAVVLTRFGTVPYTPASHAAPPAPPLPPAPPAELDGPAAPPEATPQAS